MDELAENKKFDLHIAKSYLPDGYVIVPIDPTEEMKMLGMAIANDISGYRTITPSECGMVYKAMINEAQK